MIGVIALFFVSFLLNYHWVRSASPAVASTLFFVTPFRVFQFAIGALCVFAESRLASKSPLQEALCLIGICLIAYSLATLEQDSLFPYVNALPVCAGACLLILTGDSKPNKMLIQNKVAIAIGLLSYSLYLMHWPVFVFTKYVYLNIDSAKYILFMIAVTVALAVFSYFFIERPFRKPQSTQKKYWVHRISLGFMLIFVLLGLSMKFSDGWTWRYKAELLSASAIEQGKSNRFTNLHTACAIWELDNPQKCHMDRPIQLLVLGNSHEPDGFNMFHYLYGKNEQVNLIHFGTVNDCAFEVSDGNLSSPEEALRCAQRFSTLNQQAFINQITHVVYSNHKSFEPVAKDLWAILESLMQRNQSIKLIVLGSYLETSMECSTIKNTLGSFEDCKKNEYVTYFQPEEREVSPIPQAQVLPYLYISKFKLLCPNMELSACLTYANGEPMFYDMHHLSLGFAYHLGKSIAESHSQDLVDIGLPPPDRH